MLIFATIAYLHTATRKDIENLTHNGKIIKNWNWLFAVLIGVLLFLSFDFLDKSIYAYRAYSLNNHIYCEVLQSGMSYTEVDKALNQIGNHKLINADFLINTDDLRVQPEPSHFYIVFFESEDEMTQWALNGKGLGFDSNKKLIWVSTFDPIKIFECYK
jgi:hypothetical protein